MSEALYSAQQQELIDLLRCELDEMLDFDYLPLSADDHFARSAVAEEVCLHCSNLGNAAKLVGLTGLHLGCTHLVNNFSAFAQKPETIDADARELFYAWAPVLLNYLMHFGGEQEAGAIEQFLAYAQSPNWRVALDQTELAQLHLGFSSSAVLLDEADERHNLPEFVDEDLVSLRIDADVKRELFDGLLIELPEQSEIFARAIEQLVRRDDFSALVVAQRTAHTIKGAANVVGIRGVANLMHYVEDVLDITAKFNRPLTTSLRDLLEDAADCLASMSEYLLGIGPKPEQSQEVLRRVLAWLKSSNTEQDVFCPSAVEAYEPTQAGSEFGSAAIDVSATLPVSAANVASMPDDPSTLVAPGTPSNHAAHGSQESPANQIAHADPVTTDEDDPEARHHLTVSDTAAQELLRLAGENQISTNQVLARIGLLTTGVKSADSYHQKIRQLSADLEQLVQIQGIKSAAHGAVVEGDLDPLELERYNELHSFSSQLQEVTTDSQEAIFTIETQLKELANLVAEQRQRSSETQSLLLHIRMLPVALIAPRLTRSVRQASRLIHKAVTLSIKGEDVLVDSRVLNTVVDPLMHILRNAVDHGIESAEQRLAVGKPAEGHIQIEFRRVGESLRIEVVDDGCGFDYLRIEQIARERGFLEPYDQASRAELHKILLTPGFTTREHVSHVSGRGIGLDVVQTQVRLLKGTLALSSEPGKGCRFVLDMPMSLLSAHTLLVRMGEHRFSVISRPLQQIIYLQPGDINWAVATPSFQLGAESLDVVCLDDIAMVQGSQKPTHYGALVVVKRAEGGRVAVAVEAVLASEDQIIKPLNKYACKPAGVVGAAILGDGSLSAVLDLQDLPTLQMAPSEYSRWLRTKAEIQARYVPPAAKPIALVVDDSLSARRSLAQFMNDLGMDVVTAKDGFEAIQVMQQQQPNILLVDLEMPRMNGLELTTHIRASVNRHLPIIMVTSRITDKHKQLATAAGVDAYLNKPWSEEELMLTIQDQLKGLQPID